MYRVIFEHYPKKNQEEAYSKAGNLYIEKQ